MLNNIQSRYTHSNVHRDKSNQNFTCEITNFELTCTIQEQDADMLYNLMKALFQCLVVVGYVNQALGMIRKGTVDKTANVAIPWHKSMVFLHLCTCSGPHISKRI